jgi:hypothetical protein
MYIALKSLLPDPRLASTDSVFEKVGLGPARVRFDMFQGLDACPCFESFGVTNVDYSSLAACLRRGHLKKQRDLFEIFREIFWRFVFWELRDLFGIFNCFG